MSAYDDTPSAVYTAYKRSASAMSGFGLDSFFSDGFEGGGAAGNFGESGAATSVGGAFFGAGVSFFSGGESFMGITSFLDSLLRLALRSFKNDVNGTVIASTCDRMLSSSSNRKRRSSFSLKIFS